MLDVVEFVVMGVVFGLAAGLTPGPLLVLVVTYSVRYGTRAGVTVAITPLITDLPIIGLAVIAVSCGGETPWLLGIVAIGGAVFLACLAYEILTVSPLPAGNILARPLRTGILANLFNPHPYLFWLTVGAPTVVSASSSGRFSVLAFFVSMYACIVGSKTLVAVTAGRGRGVLTSGVYVLTIRVLGITLALLAGRLLWDGFRYISTGFNMGG